MLRTVRFDMPFFVSVLVLVGLGIIFISTASYPKALSLDEGGMMYTIRQAKFAVWGLIGLFACAYTPLPVLRRLTPFFSALMLAVLVLVLIIGAKKHGNQAWILIGSTQVQPSEFAKAVLVLVLALFLARHPGAVKTPWSLLKGPYVYLFLPLLLIVGQGDYGTSIVFASAGVILIALAGAKFRFTILPLIILGVAGVLVMSGVLTSVSSSSTLLGHRSTRISAWFNPSDTTLDATFQPRNSLVAIGSGGLFGRGLCASRQKWKYLPAPHNDYILAIIAEELGFVYTIILLFVPYIFMLSRGFIIATRAPDAYSALIAAGCTVMFGLQAFVNMAVVTNMLPCMGINLPFISYGGSSLVVNMMMAGLLLNASAATLTKMTPDAAIADRGVA